MKKLLFRLALLGALLVAAVYLDGRWQGAPPYELWPGLRRGLFTLLFLLAWRFRRGRIAFAALALGAAAELFERLPPAAAPAGLYLALAFLLPLDLAATAWLRELWVWSRAGALRLASLGAEAALATALARPELAPIAARLEAPLVALSLRLPLPQAVCLVFALAALTVLLRLARRPGALELSLLASLLAVFAAFTRPEAGGLYLAAAGVMLLLALVESTFSLAFEDGLTGLPGRRSLEEALRHLGRTYAVAMVDLDHFKRLNDRFGHEVGDQVLQMVARKLAAVGGGGRAYRYGGEEFTVLFAGRTAAEAEPRLEELRRAISEHRFTVRSPGRPRKRGEKGRGKGGSGRQLKVTVSVGLAERSEKRSTPQAVMKAADKALYRAKRAGRNRVTAGR